MRRAYFQYYETFEKIVQKFKTAEDRENFRSKIIEYGLYGTAPDNLTDLEEIVWDVIKDLIDDQLHRREVNKANREEREKKRREKTEGFQEQEVTEEPEPITEGEIKNIRLEAENGMTAAQIAATHGRELSEIKKLLPKTQKFKKPDLEEIKAYCTERGNIVDAQQFLDFYESKGWKVGGAPMKDWKAAVRTWESRRTQKKDAGQTPYRILPEDRLTL